MKTYPIPMVPGPVSVPQPIRDIYQVDFGSPDMEQDFLDLYARTEAKMRRLFGTQNDVILHTGEGMIALWGALKSTLVPGDRVLAVSTGIFGSGIGAMAASIGAEVETIEFPFNDTIHDLAKIEEAIVRFQPKMITIVHCETPSGTLNPIDGVGALKAKHNVPLLYMDCVASMGGAPVRSDDWQVDLALGGSQKCLSAPPDMSMIAVSPRAWEMIEAVNYVGYDAFKPFTTAQNGVGLFPYTPNWHGVAALDAAADLLLEPSLEASFSRHESSARQCREGVRALGLDLFYAPDAIPSPTVTAVNVPDGWTWEAFDAALREKGLVVGGSYGPMAGKVFRLGHMGSQADPDLVTSALRVLEEVLSSK
ncbi:MAG: alanine--glyoxylate aminotransferase family protein [Anaerolineaceae bacterium]|nr:alanine--glyoxylate aminotransferase family protein [Anaerolineaceae bacterium]